MKSKKVDAVKPTFYDNNMDIIKLLSYPMLASIKHKEILDNIMRFMKNDDQKRISENDEQKRASFIAPHDKNNLLYKIIPKSHLDYFLLLCFIWATTYWFTKCIIPFFRH